MQYFKPLQKYSSVIKKYPYLCGIGGKDNFYQLDITDELYRTYPFSPEINQQYFIYLKNEYINIMQFLSDDQKSIKDFKKSNYSTNFTEKLDNLRKKLKEQNLHMNIENINSINQQNINKQLRIENVGYLELHGLNIERKDNQFMHCYNIQQNQSQLQFQLKSQYHKDPEKQKEIIMNKIKEQMKSNTQTGLGQQQEIQQEIQDMAQEKENQQKNTAIRVFGRKVLNVFGIKDKFFGQELSNPNIIGKIQQFEQQTLQSVNIQNKFILIEDFLIISKLQIQLSDENEQTIDKQLQKNQQSVHHIRTESLIDPQDPPSVRNQQIQIISDFNGILRGNLPCLIKNFQN